MVEPLIIPEFFDKIPFFTQKSGSKREEWNSLTSRFNPHLVNLAEVGGARDVIHTFWSGAALSPMVRLSLASMTAQQHPVTLYTYDDLDAVRRQVPQGVTVRSAITVLPRDLYSLCISKAEVRYFSDIFRYAVLYQEGGWWIDVDVVLMQPLLFGVDHVFSTQWSGGEQRHYCVGDVMRAPAGSPHMRILYEQALQRLQEGNKFQFGAVGPALLSEYIFHPKNSDLIKNLLPPTHFNSIDWTETERFIATDRSGFDLLRDPRIIGVHLWSMMWSLQKLSFEQAPKGSVSRYLKDLYEKDFYLNDLTIRHDSDKGTQYRDRVGHGYTRIYRKLIDPMILQPIRLLEIGLCRGLDEGWLQDQVPSLLTWLDYLPNAYIVGADIQDFSWFTHPRARTFRIDQSSRTALEEFASAQEEGFDIIIDDASHASAHQQLTLGVLYPLLRPGGYYIIEDLDWQPDEFETQGFPKTKDLLLELEHAKIFRSPVMTETERLYLEQQTQMITFHDSFSELANRGLQRGFGVLKKRVSNDAS